MYNKLALLISTKEHCIELKAVISQGHNLCKLKYISLEEVKISYFQKRFQSEVTESNLYRLYMKLFRLRSNLPAQKYNLFKLKSSLFSDFR